MGLSLDTYLSLTPFEFYEAYRKFIEKLEKDREWKELHDWRVARWTAYCTGNFDRTEVNSEFDILELPHDDDLLAALETRKKEAESSPERFKLLRQKFGG
ncbi:hypothetical protein [uncultured Draconibacterium sp.]|uniref:hypothetical protein n=1 Tax=uncultured Draconibacterium sp. TaxID=1573823 RepID=UPI003217B2FF